MIPRHRKAFANAAIILAVGWAVAFGGYRLAAWTNRTASQLRDYVESVSLAGLSSADRLAAIDKFAGELRALPADERQKSLLERPWAGWIGDMSADEKVHFAEDVMPRELDRLTTSFQQLPEERRRALVEEAVKRLREARTKLQLGGFAGLAAAESWDMSEELQQKLARDGLKAHYTESTVAARVDSAVFLEELQQLMGSREVLRGRMPRP